MENKSTEINSNELEKSDHLAKDQSDMESTGLEELNHLAIQMPETADSARLEKSNDFVKEFHEKTDTIDLENSDNLSTENSQTADSTGLEKSNYLSAENPKKADSTGLEKSNVLATESPAMALSIGLENSNNLVKENPGISGSNELVTESPEMTDSTVFEKSIHLVTKNTDMTNSTLVEGTVNLVTEKTEMVDSAGLDKSNDLVTENPEVANSTRIDRSADFVTENTEMVHLTELEKSNDVLTETSEMANSMAMERSKDLLTENPEMAISTELEKTNDLITENPEMADSTRMEKSNELVGENQGRVMDNEILENHEITLEPFGSHANNINGSFVNTEGLSAYSVANSRPTSDYKINQNKHVYFGKKELIRKEDLSEHLFKLQRIPDAFEKEFESLPHGKLAPWAIGMKKEILRIKNRYTSILPYDHSRVVLRRVNNDPLSDYYNANYIDGYGVEKEFIAAQGPMNGTLEDFWRMIWEQNIDIIVMLTNIKEEGKVNCERYWPEIPTTSMTIGNFKVTLKREKKDPHHIHRLLEVENGSESHKVCQYQHVGWPDHGAPQQISSVLALRQKVRNEMKKHTSHPVVVHCSAGIGATGTFLALDYLLEQADHEDHVDVKMCISLLRANRYNMVQNLIQFEFLYDALLEGIQVGVTAIPASKFIDAYHTLTKSNDMGITKITEQFKLLRKLEPEFGKSDIKSAIKLENQLKNRTTSVLAVEQHRPHLRTSRGASNYINAVFVKGYKTRRGYLVTQKPLKETQDDFWRMVYEFNCPVVVSLREPNDKEKITFKVGETVTYQQMTINTMEYKQTKTMEEFKLNLMKKSKRSRSRSMETYVFSTTWNHYDAFQGETGMQACSKLIEIYQKVQRVKQAHAEGPVVVQCLYGTGPSGLFSALGMLIEMIKTEQEVDVFHVAKQIRQSRPNLIDIVEYEYLYGVIKLYIESLRDYQPLTECPDMDRSA